MIEWRAVDWWDLPGPSRFLDKASFAVRENESGVLGLMLSNPRPDGLLDALTRRIEAGSAATVVRVDASSGLKGRSPTTVLAATAGVVATGIRSVGEFLAAPSLADLIFLIDGIPADEWYSWGLFLKLLRSERVREARMLAPSLVVVTPNGIPPDEARAVVGPELKWGGVVSRHDTQTYVERLMAWPDDSLASRTAVSVAVEMAGWDPSMARLLADRSLDDQLNPLPLFERLPDVLNGARPSWENRLVDRWDGVTFVHTAALAAAGRHDLIRARLWRAQVRTVFPFLDQVRNAFVAKYESRIRAKLPIEKNYHGKIMRYEDPFRLELYDVNECIKDDLPRREATLLRDCIKLRRNMAHVDPAEGWRIKQASELWEEIGHSFPDGCDGWEWPRCGQKLIVLVGPSGAGKSHWASRNYDSTEIVSSDQIRTEIYGSLDMGGDQEPVFTQVRATVVSRLSRGRNVVVDATNLKREDRLANVRLVPSDVPVEYIVIDRPMDEKLATAGWRASKPGLMEQHARIFDEGLSDILAGDNLPNVTVVDVRPRFALEKPAGA